MTEGVQIRALESACSALDSLIAATQLRLDDAKLAQDELNKAYLEMSDSDDGCTLLDGPDNTFVSCSANPKISTSLLVYKLKRAVAQTQRIQDRLAMLTGERDNYRRCLVQLQT